MGNEAKFVLQSAAPFSNVAAREFLQLTDTTSPRTERQGSKLKLSDNSLSLLSK